MKARRQGMSVVTVRQWVSLTIFVVFVSSTFVLTYLSNYGQWTRLGITRLAPGHEATTQLTDRKSQSSALPVLTERAPQRNCRTKTGPLTLSPEDLGLVDMESSNLTTERKGQSEMIPEIQNRIKLLAKGRNPCWRSKEMWNGLACLPYFYLAGFPRCGSTDLFRRLTFHPDIMRNPHKELQWVTRTRFRSKYGRNASLVRYKDLFSRMMLTHWSCQRNMSNAIIGDNSASTIWDNSYWQWMPGNVNCSEPRVISADVVQYLNPQARIVVIVRNPTDRLYSEYTFFNESSTKEAFHELVLESIHKATECFKEYTIRRCVYHVLNDLKLRVHVGLYSVYIDDWLIRFPRDHFHVVRLEDLARDRRTAVNKVFSFLGAEDADDDTMKKIVRQPRSNASQRSKQLGSMLSESRTALDDFYRPFNRQLAHLLQDPKYEWT